MSFRTEHMSSTRVRHPPCPGPSARAVPTSGQRPSLQLQLSVARWSSAVLVFASLGVSTAALFVWRCLQLSSVCVQANATYVSWFVARLAPGLCLSTALHFSACRTTALQGSGGGSGSQRLVSWPSMTSALSKFHSRIVGRFSHWRCRYEALFFWSWGYWHLCPMRKIVANNHLWFLTSGYKVEQQQLSHAQTNKFSESLHGAQGCLSCERQTSSLRPEDVERCILQIFLWRVFIVTWNLLIPRRVEVLSILTRFMNDASSKTQQTRCVHITIFCHPRHNMIKMQLPNTSILQLSLVNVGIHVNDTSASVFLCSI